MHSDTVSYPRAAVLAFLNEHKGIEGQLPCDEPGGAQPGYARLLEAGIVSGPDLADAIANVHNLPRAHPDHISAQPDLLDGLSRRFLRDAAIYPFDDNGEAVLAVADPTREEAIRAVMVALGRPVTLQVAGFDEIASLFERDADRIATATAQANKAGAGDALKPGIEDNPELLQDLATGAPVVHAVDNLLETAIDLGATDIHIEPQREGLRVRLRVDGLLRPYQALPDGMARAVVSRVKILAGLDIAERRLPQDGRARLVVAGQEADLRVATMPALDGEAAVIRILLRESGDQDLSRLGMGSRDLGVFASSLAEPHGLIVVCGPTGSGKTTTLAAALSRLNDPNRKILTIEDPIEYQLRGIHQTQVRPSIGLTFAHALRSYLRHDPDIIMVGEMRDTETATIGVQAAITGHLVLTTLHTNNAVDAMARLLDLKVEAFLLASALRCIVGQRLVRKLCERCRVPRDAQTAGNLLAKPDLLGLQPDDILYGPQGCQWCGGTGYRGRVGIFEVMQINPQLRASIRRDVDSAEIEGLARTAGMTSMLEDGIAKCRAGITSLDEVLRVTT